MADRCSTATNPFGLLSKQFINLIASEKQKVGKDLVSCTREIKAIDAEVDGQRVVVIDTLGNDDNQAGVKESDVLVSITKHLGIMRVYVGHVLDEKRAD